MSLNTLENTSWYFNATPDLASFQLKNQIISLSFSSNGENWAAIYITSGTYPEFKYRRSNGTSVTVYKVGAANTNWEDYRNVDISGGTGATWEKVISWYEANATQVFPDYYVSFEDMTAVADAIRTKGGTSAPLEWPNGFIAAIQAIE